jgi:hypothetical protein
MESIRTDEKVLIHNPYFQNNLYRFGDQSVDTSITFKVQRRIVVVIDACGKKI